MRARAIMITPTFRSGTVLNTRLPSLVCRVLPPAHIKQPYGRPVDEQRKHSGRRHEEGETAGVG